jgi:hypothetical protein
MAEFQVLVPNDRKVESVMGDGDTAALMVTITPPEAEFSVQTYSIPSSMPPRVITIQFEIWLLAFLGPPSHLPRPALRRFQLALMARYDGIGESTADRIPNGQRTFRKCGASLTAGRAAVLNPRPLS